MKCLRASTLAFLAASILVGLAAAQTFTVTDLGSLDPGGTVDLSLGLAINSQARVVGSSYNSVTTQHAFLWTKKAGMQDLGTLGGPNSTAWGINDSQQVVGEADLANGFTHAFLWTQAHGMQDLGSLLSYSSYAYAINNAGQVVGQAFFSSTSPHAFLWTATGGMQDLGTLGGSNSVATAINNLGQVVGYSSITGDGGTHAFLWSPQRGMQDLGTAKSYDGSYATGINDSTFIAGYSGPLQAFEITYGLFWRPLIGAQLIPYIPGSIQNFPMAINNLNQITGNFNDSQGFSTAFFYSKEEGIQNLNQTISSSSGWFLTVGTAINRNQQITGWGTVPVNGNIVNHAFLLTKIP
jgi:probable HAF family extracellular repeat protein